MIPAFGTLVHSFRFRLFAALSLIIFILMPALGYLSYFQAKRGVEHQLELFASSTATQLTGRIREYLSHLSSSVRLIQEFMENDLLDPAKPQELIRFFHLLQKDHPAFVNVLYGDVNGTFIMVPPQPPEVHILFDPRRRPWFKGAIDSDRVFWTPVYLFASSHRPGITASLPVHDSSGALRGVCGIDIDISTFSAFLANLQIGRQGFVSIIENRTGHIVAHPELVRRNPDMNVISHFSACLADLRNSGSHVGITNCSGRRWFTAYADYPGNNWSVCITLPESEYLSEISKIRRTTISLLIAGLCLASGISLLLARTLIRPMEQLEQGIKTISRGDLDCRVKVSSPDLVGSMAAAVNDMARSLAKSRDALKHSLTELAKKEKMAALGQLTAGIAHEIKNPLGIIQGSAEIMMDDSKPLAMRKQAARFVIDEVDRLNRTITEFFAFARPPEPVFRRADLQAILEETLARCSEPCSGQGVVVELSPPAAPRFCAVDPDLVHQVFMNLILNALAAMPDGGTLRCRIEERVPAATGGPGWLAVEFSDTGEGIDPEHLEQIFEPFVSFRDQGIGLGLSVVRQIITIHHGKIDVHSIPGQGTTFTLLFPLDPDDGTGQDRQERR